MKCKSCKETKIDYDGVCQACLNKTLNRDLALQDSSELNNGGQK